MYGGAGADTFVFRHQNDFVTGHSEYDPLILKYEYERDLAKGLPIQMPANYFPDDDPTKPPKVLWRSHGFLLFSNWLNYHVYQETPYDLNELKSLGTDTIST